MRVAVAGGTGLVGRMVMKTLTQNGHQPVALARSLGVDVVTGAGLDAALVDVESVVDVTNVLSTRKAVVVQFFTGGTSTLVAAEQRAGVRHHVVLSIVGVERVELGYYAGKLAQEETALAGSVPVTILRSTQFHEFADQVMARSLGPFVVLPRMRVQPVAAREVADQLAALAIGPAVGRAKDLGGPQQEQLVDMARRLLRQRADRRKPLPIRLPGKGGRALLKGGLLPGADARLGEQTFDQWLAQQA